MGKRLEIKKGDRYKMLTIIREVERRGIHRYVEVQCDCGNIKIMRFTDIRNNKLLKGCGCQKGVKKLPITEKYFGDYKFIEELEQRGYERYIKVQCKCGFEKEANLTHMRTRKPSCQHMSWSKHPLYKIWYAMISRCHDPRAQAYKDYGARGIKVCDRWINSFEDFLGDMGPRPEGYWIERTNNDEGYNPDNCIWDTPQNQLKNRRSWGKKNKNQTQLIFD